VVNEVSEFLEVRKRHLDRIVGSDELRNGAKRSSGFNLQRMPKNLQSAIDLRVSDSPETLAENRIHLGDADVLLPRIALNSVALSVWSPPYFVGKNYESHLTFDSWKELLRSVIAKHLPIIKPGGFLVINIADILCFKDEKMPKLQAEVLNGKRSSITREDVLAAVKKHPAANRHKLAKILGCSEQTIDRRLNGNNIRGGKYETQTRVKLVGGLIEQWALDAGFYPYDRRIWMKDPAWENSRWASSSYRSVDEFEYIYFFWKPGITKIDRSRLTNDEWKEWGARGVWQFPSVRTNDDHEAKFPLELPRRTIKLLTDAGDLVLDCFAGSGTTAVAAIQEGRRFLGVELQPTYVELAMNAVSKMLRFPYVDKPNRSRSGNGTSRRNREGLNASGSPGSLRFSGNSR